MGLINAMMNSGDDTKVKKAKSILGMYNSSNKKILFLLITNEYYYF